MSIAVHIDNVVCYTIKRGNNKLILHELKSSWCIVHYHNSSDIHILFSN